MRNWISVFFFIELLMIVLLICFIRINVSWLVWIFLFWYIWWMRDFIDRFVCGMFVRDFFIWCVLRWVLICFLFLWLYNFKDLENFVVRVILIEIVLLCNNLDVYFVIVFRVWLNVWLKFSNVLMFFLCLFWVMMFVLIL